MTPSWISLRGSPLSLISVAVATMFWSSLSVGPKEFTLIRYLVENPGLLSLCPDSLQGGSLTHMAPVSNVNSSNSG
jgi:hypothetical protein